MFKNFIYLIFMNDKKKQSETQGILYSPDELSLSINHKKKKGETKDSDVFWNFSQQSSDENFFENSLSNKTKAPLIVLKLSNCSMVYGGIVFPYLVQQTGQVEVVFSFLAFYFLGNFQTTLHMKLGQQIGQVNLQLWVYSPKLHFSSITETVCLFTWAPKFVNLVLFLNYFLYCVLLLTCFGQALSEIIKFYTGLSDQYWSSLSFCSLIGGIAIFPLCLRVTYLQNVAAISRLIVFLGLFLTIFGRLIYQLINTKVAFFFQADEGSFMGAMRALPALMLIFSYNQNFIEEYCGNENEMSAQIQEYSSLLRSLTGSLVIMTSYFIICFFSYTVFAKYIDYQNENIIRLLYVDHQNQLIINTISLILIGLPGLIQILQYNYLSVRTLNQLLQIPSKSKNFKGKMMISSGIFQLAVILTAASLRDVCDVITIMGATTQNLITVILPSLLYIKYQRQLEKSIDCMQTLAFFTLILGVAFFFLSIAGFAYQFSD